MPRPVRFGVSLPQIKRTWQVNRDGRDTREPARLFAERVMPAFNG